MPRTWTPEQRAAAAERIRANKPWEKSTGPRSRKGKKKSSQNAVKHGLKRAETLRALKLFKVHREFLRLSQALIRIDQRDAAMLHLQTNYIKTPAETST